MHEQFTREQPLSSEAIVAQAHALDPGLVEAEPLFVEAGARFIQQVTEQYGTPTQPRWAEGSREATLMLYHNGESATSAGHTSSDAAGAGVPRNALIIAQAVNEQAAREVIGPNARARMFAAAAGHDLVQLCGRAAAFAADGDEIISAQAVHDELRRRGASLEAAEDAASDVLATTFDNGTQRINYTRHAASILTQQVVAAADLLGLATSRGPRGAIEYAVESLGLSMHGRILQQYLHDEEMVPGASATPAAIFTHIEHTPELRAKLIKNIRGQAGFASGFVFADDVIREACGARIDELFPGRLATAAALQSMAERATAGETLPMLWQELQN